METSLLLDRRAALKLGIGTGIGSLLGLASARAEDRPSNQQPAGTSVNVAPRTDPPPLVDARFPCEIAEDVWVILTAGYSWSQHIPRSWKKSSGAEHVLVRRLHSTHHFFDRLRILY
jgi:hypothetical protein